MFESDVRVAVLANHRADMAGCCLAELYVQGGWWHAETVKKSCGRAAQARHSRSWIESGGPPCQARPVGGTYEHERHLRSAQQRHGWPQVLLTRCIHIASRCQCTVALFSVLVRMMQLCRAWPCSAVRCPGREWSGRRQGCSYVQFRSYSEGACDGSACCRWVHANRHGRQGRVSGTRCIGLCVGRCALRYIFFPFTCNPFMSDAIVFFHGDLLVGNEPASIG